MTPPIWERLADLHARPRPQDVVFENALRAHLPPGVLDRRGILLATGEAFRDDPGLATGWFADTLGLRGSENWRRLRTACGELTRSFFADSADGAAWVYFESCRDPVAKQAEGVVQMPWGSDWELPPVGRRGEYRFRSADPASHDVGFKSAALRVIDASGRRAGRLVRFARYRGLPACVGLAPGLFDTWCAGDPVDDRESVAAGRIPAGRAFQVTPDVNVGRLLNWVKLDAGGHVSAFSLEIHPETSELISVRRTRVPFELLLRIHPRYQDWFARLIGCEAGPTDPSDYDGAPLPEGLDVRVGRLLLGALRDPTRVRFRLRTSLATLCRFVELESLRQAGNKAKGSSHRLARRHLGNLERWLGLSLLTTRVGEPGSLNSSTPATEAELIARWLRGHPELLGEVTV